MTMLDDAIDISAPRLASYQAYHYATNTTSPVDRATPTQPFDLSIVNNAVYRPDVIMITNSVTHIHTTVKIKYNALQVLLIAPIIIRVLINICYTYLYTGEFKSLHNSSFGRSKMKDYVKLAAGEWNGATQNCRRVTSRYRYDPVHSQLCECMITSGRCYP